MNIFRRATARPSGGPASGAIPDASPHTLSGGFVRAASGELACHGLLAGYGDKTVLHGLDLTFRPGELTAVIGPNGSGKSTLLRCLCGTLPPGAGQVLLDGAPLAALDARARARRIAVLPQRPGTPEAFALPARDVVLLGRYARLPRHGFVTATDRAAALAALNEAEALPLAHRPLGELSGGELQRVFLARALAQEADVLLLDEPASAMDPAHLAALFALLARRARAGATVVAVLHDVNAAALFCRRIVALRSGRAAFDTRPELLTSQHLEALYDAPFHTLAHPTAGVPQFCLAAPAGCLSDGAVPDGGLSG